MKKLTLNFKVGCLYRTAAQNGLVGPRDRPTYLQCLHIIYNLRTVFRYKRTTLKFEINFPGNETPGQKSIFFFFNLFLHVEP